MKTTNLKNFSTKALIEELENRAGVKKIAVGPYQDYRLETKFDLEGTKEIVSDTVLIVNHPTL